ncbi:MAG: UDP-N-acetylmuramate--L-alanine ligase [Syntrophothermus sp.]
MEFTGKRVHLVGIGGSGMSPIAKVLLEMGVKVSGSDLKESEVTKRLESMGARVYIGHNASNIDEADLMVVSTAIDEANPELKAARERHMPVLHRSEMLARLMNERYGIAVAGAHGKTTVTSMISLVLERAGKDPTVVIGGEVADLGGSAKFGRGRFLVAEADESDRSFLRYHPKITVVTNIEADHLEYYEGTLTKLILAYQEFLENLSPDGVAVLGVDDENVRSIIPAVQRRVITYGLDREADFTARNVKLHERGSEFEAVYQGESLGVLKLQVPGLHNVANALATLAVCREAGVSVEEVRDHIVGFHGAKRRFQLIGDVGGVMVIDDYAHHPTEIKATIKAAKDGWKRPVIAVFQPHRYTRTHFLMEEFGKAFGQADEVIIAGIYSPPPEKPIPGVSAERMVELIRANGGRNVKLIGEKNDIVEYLAQRAKPGDMVLTMGAGDIWQVAGKLAERLREAGSGVGETARGSRV